MRVQKHEDAYYAEILWKVSRYVKPIGLHKALNKKGGRGPKVTSTKTKEPILETPFFLVSLLSALAIQRALDNP